MLQLEKKIIERYEANFLIRDQFFLLQKFEVLLVGLISKNLF